MSKAKAEKDIELKIDNWINALPTDFVDELIEIIRPSEIRRQLRLLEVQASNRNVLDRRAYEERFAYLQRHLLNKIKYIRDSGLRRTRDRDIQREWKNETNRFSKKLIERLRLEKEKLIYNRQIPPKHVLRRNRSRSRSRQRRLTKSKIKKGRKISALKTTAPRWRTPR